MAVCAIVTRYVCRRCLGPLGAHLARICSRNFNEKSETIQVDALDDFTSQLMQRKIEKWCTRKTTQSLMYKKDTSSAEEDDCGCEVIGAGEKDLKVLFQETIEFEDNVKVLDLIRQCIKYRRCPSLPHLIHVLTLCAQNGDKGTITQIKELCEELQPEILQANSNFRHFYAEAVWVKGNVTEALKMFQEVYRENVFLRCRIRLIFEYLVSDMPATRSEAALVNVVKFSEDLLKNYTDFFPLVCVWQSCFLSDWYTDQCLAMELLKRNDGFCKMVVNRIPYVVTVSLCRHRTEVVYRLLEMLLDYKMSLQYNEVLQALLDYQIRQGDLRRSSEIVLWSVEHGVELPAIYHVQFLALFHGENVTKWDKKLVEHPKTDLHYKF